MGIWLGFEDETIHHKYRPLGYDHPNKNFWGIEDIFNQLRQRENKYIQYL